MPPPPTLLGRSGAGGLELPTDMQLLVLTFLRLEELVRLCRASRSLTERANDAIFRLPAATLRMRHQHAAATIAKAECIAQRCGRLSDIDLSDAPVESLGSCRRILERSSRTLTRLKLPCEWESLLPLVAACGPTLRRLDCDVFSTPGDSQALAKLLVSLPHLTSLRAPRHRLPVASLEHRPFNVLQPAQCPIRATQLSRFQQLRVLSMPIDRSVSMTERLQLLDGLATRLPDLHALDLTVECSPETLLAANRRPIFTFKALRQLSIGVDGWSRYQGAVFPLPIICAPAAHTLYLRYYRPPLWELIHCFPSLHHLDKVDCFPVGPSNDLPEALALLDAPGGRYWKQLRTISLDQFSVSALMSLLTSARLPALRALSIQPPLDLQNRHGFLRALLKSLPLLEVLILGVDEMPPPPPQREQHTTYFTHHNLRSVHGLCGRALPGIDGVDLPNLCQPLQRQCVG